MFGDIKTSNPPILEIVAEISIESSEPEALVVGSLQKIAIESHFKSIGVANLREESGENELLESGPIWMGYEYSDDDRINFLFGPNIVAFNWAKHPDDDENIYSLKEGKIKEVFYSLLNNISKTNTVKINFKTLRYKIANTLEDFSFFENSNFKISINNEDLIRTKKIRALVYKEEDDVSERTITITSPATLYSGVHKKTIKKTIVEVLSKSNISSCEEACAKTKAIHEKNKNTFFSLLKEEYIKSSFLRA